MILGDLVIKTGYGNRPDMIGIILEGSWEHGWRILWEDGSVRGEHRNYSGRIQRIAMKPT